MTTEPLPRIDGVARSGPATAPPKGPVPEGSTFQRLLESLRQLRTTGAAVAEAKSPAQLQDALRAAEDGFVTAMDLRQRLEAAFRNRLP